MKKFLLSAAILATFASCSETEVNEVVTSSDPISFSTLNDRVVAKSATENGDAYQVYALYNSTTNWYFNDEVSDADASTSLHYWPTDQSTLDFYAYAPSNLSATVSADGADASISIAYEVAAEGTEDFTVAAPVTNQYKGDVELAFSHMLSKVLFKVELSENLTDAGYVLDEESYEVDLALASSGGTMDVLTGLWSNSNSTIITHTGAQVYNIYPQTSTGNTITVSDITIYGTDSYGEKLSTATVSSKTLYPYTIAANDIIGNAFVKGTYYTITFVIDGSSLDSDGGTIIPEDLTITFKSSFNAAWDATAAAELEAVGVTVVSTEIETVDLLGSALESNTAINGVAYNTAGSIITNSSDATATSDDTGYTALLTYLDTITASTSSTGTFTPDTYDYASATLTQKITTTVYSVNGAEFTVVTYEAPEATYGSLS